MALPPIFARDPQPLSLLKAFLDSGLHVGYNTGYGVDSRVIALRIVPFVKRRKQTAEEKSSRPAAERIDLTPPFGWIEPRI